MLNKYYILEWLIFYETTQIGKYVYSIIYITNVWHNVEAHHVLMIVIHFLSNYLY